MQLRRKESRLPISKKVHARAELTCVTLDDGESGDGSCIVFFPLSQEAFIDFGVCSNMHTRVVRNRWVDLILFSRWAFWPFFGGFLSNLEHGSGLVQRVFLRVLGRLCRSYQARVSLLC